MTIEYLDVYEQELNHQREHDSVSAISLLGDRPSEYCFKCLTSNPRLGQTATEPSRFAVKLRYAWAVPNEQALKTIAAYSPRGVVEIGAGGGYWAKLLRERGVDVIAYDPDPAGTGIDGHTWHDGRQWSEVLHGDHTAVIGHPDRTLLLCWPCYEMDWTHEAVELYAGDTIIYIGEPAGGCTGTDRMHALLGAPSCYHFNGEPCDHDWPEPLFEEIETVSIPQWQGLHDYLVVYTRRRADRRA